MTIQKSLFSSGNKATHLIEAVPISDVELSEHNPRRTWDDAHISRLAELIEQNGYDGTYAIKCYQENGKYKCFAGSNRLKACQKLNLEFIPVFVYEGYTPEEIWKMAYDDNEQAETQQRLCVVDLWEDYAAKARQGMTQEKIASILGVSQTLVKFRLDFSSFPTTVKEYFITKDFLNERHARELTKLLPGNIFNQETLLTEIIDAVCKRYTRPTAKNFQSKVEAYNEAISAAVEWQGKLKDRWRLSFVEKIRDERSAAVINNQGRIHLREQEQAAKAELRAKFDELNKLEAAQREAQKELERQNRISKITDNLIHGDSRKQFSKAPDGIKLIFTDPPYGTNFQSNYRQATSKNEKIKADSSLEKALSLTNEVIQALIPKMADHSAVLMWCDWEHEPDFRKMLAEAGLSIKNSIVWVKPNHNMGDLEGAFGVKHERLIFAVKGRPILSPRLADVLHGDAFLQTDHPTPKPIDLIQKVIESLTLEEDWIVDPFMGCGSTGVAAIRASRKFWGCEIEKHWWEDANKFVQQEIS